jgi:purine-binding chemotaxis protein CheW
MVQTDTLNSYLTFSLGEELFAANVGKILEILEIPTITKVPRSPDFMRGVINLRGSVLPVIDTRAKFGLPRTEDTISTCIVVMSVVFDGQDITIGATADAVQEVIEIDEAQILAAPTMGSKFKSEFILGMVKREDQFVMMLDLDKVFSSSDATILQDIVVNPSSEAEPS